MSIISIIQIQIFEHQSWLFEHKYDLYKAFLHLNLYEIIILRLKPWSQGMKYDVNVACLYGVQVWCRLPEWLLWVNS
jgi:hypothetical protein